MASCVITELLEHSWWCVSGAFKMVSLLSEIKPEENKS
jgi:hypothetical protein